MSDLFGNHIVGFPTRWLNYVGIARNKYAIPGVVIFFENLSNGLYRFYDRNISLITKKELKVLQMINT